MTSSQSKIIVKSCGKYGKVQDMKIAVLDDNLIIGEMLQQALELARYRVVVYSSPSAFFTATNAEKAKPTSTPLDLMIIDLVLLEGSSGIEVIHQVRNIFADLPIILISEGSSWEIEAAAKALPSVRILRKPFRMATLLSMVKELTPGIH